MKWERNSNTSICGNFRLVLHDGMWHGESKCYGLWYPTSAWCYNSKKRAKAALQDIKRISV